MELQRAFGGNWEIATLPELIRFNRNSVIGTHVEFMNCRCASTHPPFSMKLLKFFGNDSLYFMQPCAIDLGNGNFEGLLPRSEPEAL